MKQNEKHKLDVRESKYELYCSAAPVLTLEDKAPPCPRRRMAPKTDNITVRHQEATLWCSSWCRGRSLLRHALHCTAYSISLPISPLDFPVSLVLPPPSAIRARFVDYSWCLRHTCYAVRKCSENLSIKKCLISEGQSIYEMSID